MHLARTSSPSKLPYFNQTDDDWHLIDRIAKCYQKGALIDAPFQYNIDQLSREDFLRAKADFEEANSKNIPGKTLSEYFKNQFGDFIANEFLIPYNEKLFGMDLKNLSLDSIKRFFPPAKREMFSQQKATTYNTHFWYPKNDGIDLLIKGISANGLICDYNSIIEKVDLDRKTIYTRNFIYEYDSLISSIPLPLFCAKSDSPNLQELGKNLSATSTLSINLVVKGVPPKQIENVHWVYIADPKIVFYRMGIYSQFNSNMAKDQYYSLYLEVGESQFKSMNNIKSITDLCIQHAAELGWVNPKDISQIISHTIAPAYVNFDHNHKVNVTKIMEYCDSRNIQLVGRYGRWDYISMEDGIYSGIDAAQKIQ